MVARRKSGPAFDRENFGNQTNFQSSHSVRCGTELFRRPSDCPPVHRSPAQEANVNNELFSGVSFVICEDIKDVENVSVRPDRDLA